jgi:hypothetical protein
MKLPKIPKRFSRGTAKNTVLVTSRKEMIAQALYRSWARRHANPPTWQAIVAMKIHDQILAGWMEDADAAVRALPLEDLINLFKLAEEREGRLTPEVAMNILRGWQQIILAGDDAPHLKAPTTH